MAIYDFRRVSTDASLHADICIIGSGPAGWTVADELRDSGLSVLVLESGGALESGLDQYDAEVEKLNATIDTGQPLFNGRRRTLGGTTEVAGWANRTIAFDDIDYEARAWVAHSGWPIDAATIAPYLSRAAAQLGVDETTLGAPRLPRGGSWPLIDSDLLAPVTWTFGQGEDRQVMRYARRFRERMRDDLRVLVHATVTQIVTNSEGTRVEAVEIDSPNGKHARVATRAVVLAAGGIENPRILLYSNRIVAGGLGNGNGLVGRYLMDHPRDLDMAVTFDPTKADQLRAIFGPFRLDGGGGFRFVANGFALSAARQHKDGLLNAAAWFIEEATEDDPIEAAKRLVRRRGDLRSDVGAVIRNATTLLRATHGRLARGHALHRKAGKIGLVIGSEQQPDPESRVTLAAAAKDRFGLPVAETHWRINSLERASQTALAQTIGNEFARLGLPEATLAGWVRNGRPESAPLVDGCHPTGTTRMASDPRLGVVDATCQVHGVAGLYIAGSSVFPTAGHANPTLMISAMAVRLADHLAKSLKPNGKPVSNELSERLDGLPNEGSRRKKETGLGWAGTTVAVTGASGFLGARLAEQLVDHGARVICLLRAPAGARLQALDVDVRIVDLTDRDAARAVTTDIDFIFHCAYDWTDEAWNGHALGALIDAARANRWKRLIHVSSFVVYDLPPRGKIVEQSLETTTPWGYARTKLSLETALLKAVERGDLEATIIQPTLIYGPYSQAWTIDPLDKLTNGTVILPGRGDGACNAVFVDDVVQAMLLVAKTHDANGERFLISGDPVRWSDFYEALAKLGDVAGPTYLSRETILRKNRTVARLLRGVLTPRLLARRIAGVGPIHSRLSKWLEGGSGQIPIALKNRLYGPITRLPGHKHLPDANELRFLESAATIESDKARSMLGYAPRFSFAAGMDATATHLRMNRRRQMERR